MKEATTEFCRFVAAVVAVVSSPELVAHPFGFSLVVATVDLQNSVAAASWGCFVLVVVATHLPKAVATTTSLRQISSRNLKPS